MQETSTPWPVPKNWLVLSYINSKDYELDLKFDETEMKSKSENWPNNKVKNFCNGIVVMGE